MPSLLSVYIFFHLLLPWKLVWPFCSRARSEIDGKVHKVYTCANTFSILKIFFKSIKFVMIIELFSLVVSRVFLPTVTVVVTAVTILLQRHGNGTRRSKQLGFKKFKFK